MSDSGFEWGEYLGLEAPWPGLGSDSASSTGSDHPWVAGSVEGEATTHS